MSILDRIEDAKNVWVKCKGTMLALDQDDVHELWEEIIKIQTRNSRQRRKNEELLRKYNELKDQLQQKENIIKEVREYVEEKEKNNDNWIDYELLIEPVRIKEILDKERESE